MTRDDVLTRLRAHEAELRAAGIEALDLFGSVARGDAGPDSDVDLACRLQADKQIGLFEYAGLQLKLEELLGSDVDLVERDQLRPRFRRRVESSMVPVF